MGFKEFMLAFLICMVLSFAIGYSFAHAAEIQDVSMSVLIDKHPVRELSDSVAIPFDSEYELRIANNTNRDCTVSLTIDGSKVSMLGDFVVRANDSIDLERFLDKSLTKGKRFKFVRLNHPDVDDSNRNENGNIVAEIRFEKQYHEIMRFPHSQDYFYLDADIYVTTECNANIPASEWEAGITDCSATTDCSTSPGATIGGRNSFQEFYRTEIDLENESYQLKLKLVGINTDD